ncbi:glycosyltransferase [uncultured Hydrogenophaga sp.]|uniref:glycosyltransferase n=1 Tax=uncultured Hydrogenophaga sp. TaxID=199683 RepID=UPI0025901301|nr:glycosyltransferase [uncultured Hydrogenophaga sp.]
MVAGYRPITHPDWRPVPAQRSSGRPILLVVVDTEEEFDWSRPFDRDAVGTASIPAQDHAHAVFDKYGIVPTYVLDHAVARSAPAAAYLRRLVDAGRAHFGTHCHPWVTPPFEDEVNDYNSFHGNLRPELEAAKLEASTDAVAQAFGQRPLIFKAGRYGVGAGTLGVIQRLGYRIDCSFVPATSFARVHGPNFLGTSMHPFFMNESRELLEVPLTVGYGGRAWWAGQRFAGLWDNPLLQRVRVQSVLSRLGVLWRARLSPEGFDADTQIRLMEALYAQGVRVFSLTYHSPSLAPGHTPYVRNDQDLQEFLRRIDRVCAHFRDRLGGEFSTLTDLWRDALAATPVSPAAPLQPEALSPQRGTIA